MARIYFTGSIDYRKIYRLFDESAVGAVTPLTADCGTVCGGACLPGPFRRMRRRRLSVRNAAFFPTKARKAPRSGRTGRKHRFSRPDRIRFLSAADTAPGKNAPSPAASFPSSPTMGRTDAFGRYTIPVPGGFVRWCGNARMCRFAGTLSVRFAVPDGWSPERRKGAVFKAAVRGNRRDQPFSPAGQGTRPDLPEITPRRSRRRKDE